jgi:hypothetical protein
MPWTEEDQKTKNRFVVNDREKIEKLDKAVQEGLPVVLKENDQGAKPFLKLQFQPVKSPGIFEAEFGVKGDDIIFHFWPWGFAAAKTKGQVPPSFRSDFYKSMVKAMDQNFDPKRTEFVKDQEMGYFVKARGYALHQFWKKLAIETCSQLHTILGGD